ncbi:MAG: flavin-binding protein dodecin [Gammaproteobacteria bacterium]|jgi:flavin-binding protein dodecin
MSATTYRHFRTSSFAAWGRHLVPETRRCRPLLALLGVCDKAQQRMEFLPSQIMQPMFGVVQTLGCRHVQLQFLPVDPPAHQLLLLSRQHFLGRLCPQCPRTAACIVQTTCTKEITMTDHVYKILELTGSSATSSDDAIRQAIAKAGETVRGMQWFQVTIKVGVTIH